MGLIARMVDALRDRRHPSYIDHTLLDLVKQRVFQIACGYEDAVDCDDLRHDPGVKAACDRLPLSGPDLGSQSTMTRLENDVRRSDLYRLAQAFVRHNRFWFLALVSGVMILRESYRWLWYTGAMSFSLLKLDSGM